MENWQYFSKSKCVAGDDKNLATRAVMAILAFQRKVGKDPSYENSQFKRWGVPAQHPLMLYLAHTRVGLDVVPIPPHWDDDQPNVREKTAHKS